MKKVFCLRCLLIGSVIFLCTLFASCNGEILLDFQQSAGNTLQISFSGECGDALQGMILAATGSTENTEIFDASEISNQLKNTGFSAVDVKSSGAKITITMKDEGCKSYIFDSGLLSVRGKKLFVSINQKNLKAFYDFSDEQIQMLLDLFISPAFNGEKMSAEDYCELIGVVYGTETGKEISGSQIKVTVKNADGTSSAKTLSLPSVLCGQAFEW